MFNFNFIRKIKKFFFPFYKSSDLKFVFKKLQQDVPSQSKVAMFVGGCVRKHLLNEEICSVIVSSLGIGFNKTMINKITEQIKNKIDPFVKYL